MTLILLTLACGQDISVTETAKCDGVLQASEEWVDQPFDKDEDGYPDGGNAECQEAYAAEDLDCDDNNAAISPSAVEIGCNLLDDDCNPDTLDEEDRDEDTYTSCEDCDDFSPEVNPDATEVLCNNLDDDCNPDTLDEEDRDEDGYSECDLDCDDQDPNVNPGMDEVLCNGVDDDCSEVTSDGEDLDGDGVTECTDCDDDDLLNFPGNDEVCDDDQDNDCDSQIDEACTIDYSGTYTLDQRISYECAEVFGVPAVSLNFQAVIAADTHPNLEMGTSGAQPGNMTGTFSTATEFSVSRTISGSCTESYSIEGEFIDANTFEGTFRAGYSGGGNSCRDCTTQAWAVVGTK